MDRKLITQIHDDLVKFSDHVNLTYVAPVLKSEDWQTEPKHFLFTLLFKLNNGLSSCRLFLTQDELWLRHLDGLFIILRTLLSDALTMQYVIRKNYHGNDADIISNIRPLYTEHLKFTLRDLRKFGTKFWGYSDKQKGEEEKNIRTAYPEYFKPDGDLIFKPDTGTIGDKAAFLVDDNSEPEVRNLIIKAHNLYMHFSKYEHLGILSLQMIWRQYDEKNHPTLFRQIVESIAIASHCMELSIRIWNQFNVGQDSKFQDAIGQFQKHHEQLLALEAAYLPGNSSEAEEKPS